MSGNGHRDASRLEVGRKVEALFYGRWWGATLLKCNQDDTWDVLWDEDGSITYSIHPLHIRPVGMDGGTSPTSPVGERRPNLFASLERQTRHPDAMRKRRAPGEAEGRATHHFALIKALSAVQLCRGRFLSYFRRHSSTLEMGFADFCSLFEEVFALQDGSDLVLPRTLAPRPDVEHHVDLGDIKLALLEKMFDFFDLDGSGAIDVEELKRFAKAPLSVNDQEPPVTIQDKKGKEVTVEQWKRTLWVEVVQETQQSMVRTLGMGMSPTSELKLHRKWADKYHIPVDQFMEDVAGTGLNYSKRQLDVIAMIADSTGELEQTVDTGLVLRHCTLNPARGFKSSFPIVFTANQRSKAQDQIGLVLYLAFLSLFTFFLITDKGLSSGIWVTETIKDLFLDEELWEDSSQGAYFKKGFHDINSLSEFWLWMKGPVLRGFWDPSATDALQFSNVPVGAIKIRQKRVQVNSGRSCKSQHRLFDHNAAKCFTVGSAQHRRRLEEMRDGRCFPDWGEGSEATEQFPLLIAGRQPRLYRSPVSNTTLSIDLTEGPWNWRDCHDLNGTSLDVYYGKVSDRFGYDGSGYALILPFRVSRDEADEELTKLEQGGWIDDQTRAVLITFFTYNVNLRLLSRFSFVVELTAGGYFIPTSTTVVFRLFDWEAHTTMWNIFLIGYIIVLFSFIFWFFWRLVQAVRERMHMMYLTSGCSEVVMALWYVLRHNLWYLFDFVNYVIFITTTAMRLYHIDVGFTSSSIICLEYYPPHYEHVSHIVQTMSILDAVNALLMYFRVFYYLKLNNGINMLLRTVITAGNNIFNIVVIFLILFIAFGLCAYVVYGHVLVSFRDFGATFSSLARMMVGDFNYSQLREERRVFTPFFFLAFMLVCVFLLLNMIIAVLQDAFQQVKDSNWDLRPFIAKLKHDPTVNLSPPSPLETLKASPLIRELKSLVCWCRPEAARENPRLFWRDYAKVFHDLERGRPREVVVASILLLQLEYTADRLSSDHRTLVQRKHLVPVPVSLGGAARYRVEPVAVYLKRVLGGWATFITYERLLIRIPAMQMKMSETELWLDLLDEHHHWRRGISFYATFEVPYSQAYARRRRHADLYQSSSDDIDAHSLSPDIPASPLSRRRYLSSATRQRGPSLPTLNWNMV